MLWDEKLALEEESSIDSETGARVIDYIEALREAIAYKMETDETVFLAGQGIDDPNALFGITKGLRELYSPLRLFDTPVSEEGMMGICNGAAMSGMRPIYFHNRPDFLLLAFNQIVNHGSKIHWMDNGKNSVPIVVWSAIGRGWGSGPQHSQAIQGLLLSVPGIKIVMPSTPYDAKGLILSAIEDNNPTFIFEHRHLMKLRGNVPKAPYTIPIGKGVIRRAGTECTVVGASHAIHLALKAAKELKKEEEIEVEVIDLRSLKPLDEPLILESIKKTGKLLIVDTGWAFGGVCAEIGCLVAEKGFSFLRAPIKRIALPDSPAPAGYVLEHFYYPNTETIKEGIKNLIDDL